MYYDEVCDSCEQELGETEGCRECCEHVGHEYDPDNGGYCLNCEAHPCD